MVVEVDDDDGKSLADADAEEEEEEEFDTVLLVPKLEDDEPRLMTSSPPFCFDRAAAIGYDSSSSVAPVTVLPMMLPNFS